MATDKKISEMTTKSTPANNDKVVMYDSADGTASKGMTYANFIASLKNLSAFGNVVNAAEYATINAAAAALPSEGGTVFVPPGNYTISAPIESCRLNIAGCGKNNTTITVTETMDYAIKFLTGDGGQTFFRLSDFTLDGDDKATNLIYLSESYAKLEKVDLKDCTNACIYNEDGWNITLDDCVTGDAVYGFYSASAAVNSVINKHRNHCTNGLYFRNAAVNPEGIRITDSLIFATGGSAISVVSANAFEVDNCILDGVTHRGVDFGTSSIRGRVTNCYIDCNGATADYDACIVVASNCSDMVFANNHLLSGYQGIKIDADVSNQTSSIKIVNNHFSSTIVVDIWLDSVLYGFIAGNHCSNSTSSIYEHNTKSNGQNVFVGNYLASTPTKSSASYWFNNFGDMAWTAFTPVFTGFSADPAATGTRYIQIGKTVVVNYACFGGTSNATTLTASLPITPKTNGSSYIRNFWARVQDNGATPADPGLVEFDIDSGSLTVYKDHSGAAFTNSGTKGFRAVITYEIG